MPNVFLFALLTLLSFQAIGADGGWRNSLEQQRDAICVDDKDCLTCLKRVSELAQEDPEQHGDSYAAVFYPVLWEGSETNDPDFLSELLTLTPVGTHHLEEHEAWLAELPFKNTATYMTSISHLIERDAEVAEELATAAGFLFVIQERRQAREPGALARFDSYRNNSSLDRYFRAFDAGSNDALDYLQGLAEDRMSRKSAWQK